VTETHLDVREIWSYWTNVSGSHLWHANFRRFMINVMTSIFLWWIFISSVSTFLCLVFKFQLIFHKESTMCIINMSLNYSNLCSFSFCMTLLCVLSSFWIRTMALSEYSLPWKSGRISREVVVHSLCVPIAFPIVQRLL
jgi:hypothetical protein